MILKDEKVDNTFTTLGTGDLPVIATVLIRRSCVNFNSKKIFKIFMK